MNILYPKLTSVIVIICVMFLASSCGMSSLTSSLSGGLFSKESNEKVKNVTEEQLLNAARSDYGGSTTETAAVNVAYGCPRFKIWARDNAITKYADGQVGDGLAVIYRGEITRTARECNIRPGRITVKYGFSGRVLLGPKGKPGQVVLPVTVFVSDSKRERIAHEKLEIVSNVTIEKPISYFSQVKIISFDVPPNIKPGEFEVFIGFDTQ